MGVTPDILAAPAAELRAAAGRAGLPVPEVAVLTTLPLSDLAAARDLVARYAAAGATRIIHGARYLEAAEFRAALDGLAAVAEGAPAAR